MQLNVCLSDLEQHNDILYTDVKYSTITYKYSILINYTVCQILCRKLNFIEFIAQELVINFNNEFYWSILYKKVYLRLEEKYISSALMHIVYIID